MEPVIPDEEIREEPKQQYEHASFGIRMGAAIMDFVVFFPIFAFSSYNMLSWKLMWLHILFALPQFFYKPIMEWKYGATLGKMIVGIHLVNDKYEQNITSEQSMKRFLAYFPYYVSSLFSSSLLFLNTDFLAAKDIQTLSKIQPIESSEWMTSFFAGFLAFSVFHLLFNPLKQTWHDRFAKTYVVYKLRQ